MKSEEQVNAEVKTLVFDDKDVGARASSSDAEIGTGEAVTVETTKRGLKARHAQMIALGGTIGKCQKIRRGIIANNI
jgi:amino acid transporter